MFHVSDLFDVEAGCGSSQTSAGETGSTDSRSNITNVVDRDSLHTSDYETGEGSVVRVFVLLILTHHVLGSQMLCFVLQGRFAVDVPPVVAARLRVRHAGVRHAAAAASQEGAEALAVHAHRPTCRRPECQAEPGVKGE